MKKLRFATIITLASTASFPCLTYAAEPLTLEQCISIALSDNPTVRVADMEIEKADYSRKETLGKLLPTLGFDGSYNRTLQQQVVFMDFDMPGMGDMGSEIDAAESKNDGIKMGRDNTYNLGFSASLPLVAPQLWQALKLSDIEIAKAAEQARASRLDLVNQVKNAYYALQLANDSRKVVQQSYDMAALTHDIYVKRFSVGDASEYEVLRTSVAIKNIEPQIIQCDIAVSRAHLQLAILMGINAETKFDIAGTLSEYEDTMYGTAMRLQRPDLTSNTQLAMLDLNTRSIERNLAMQKASLWPTLALAGSYSWNSSSNGSPFRNFRWTSYSMVGLSLSVPLYQGGQRYSRIKQAQIQLDEMAFNRENLMRNLNSQATLAMKNIRLNLKQINSSKESVGEAQRAYDIQNRSFEIGAASYLDLRDSELSLTQARLAYCQAIYNYLVAASDLELLLGTAKLPEK